MHWFNDVEHPHLYYPATCRDMPTAAPQRVTHVIPKLPKPEIHIVCTSTFLYKFLQQDAHVRTVCANVCVYMKIYTRTHMHMRVCMQAGTCSLSLSLSLSLLGPLTEAQGATKKRDRNSWSSPGHCQARWPGHRLNAPCLKLEPVLCAKSQ